MNPNVYESQIPNVNKSYVYVLLEIYIHPVNIVQNTTEVMRHK